MPPHDAAGWFLARLTAAKVAPTVTINQGAAQAEPTSASLIVFEVVFRQPVPGFAGGDIDLSGTAGGTLSAAVAGSGTSDQHNLRILP